MDVHYDLPPNDEKEIETDICSYDGEPYAFWDCISVYNEATGEWEIVSKKNLENYKKLING